MVILTSRKVYHDGSQLLEGFIARPKSIRNGVGNPTVVIFHTLMGLTEFECKRAKFLAKNGLVAFAADIYGRHIRNSTHEDGERCLRYYLENRNTLLRSRIAAVLAYVRGLPFVNPKKIAAIGFGFGGLCVLDICRHNFDIRCGVICHGMLSPMTDYANIDRIQTKLLICHGDLSTKIEKETNVLLNELRERGADFQFIRFSNAEDDFAIPGGPTLSSQSSPGSNYNPRAAKRLSKLMLMFFSETLGTPKYTVNKDRNSHIL